MVTPQLVGEVASNTVEQVIPVEGGCLDDLVNESQAGSGPAASETATARLSSMIGEGVLLARKL